MKKILILAVLSLAFIGCSDNDSSPTSDDMKDDMESVGVLHEDGYYEITPAEAKAMIDDESQSLVVIDVSPLWAAGHLPGALELPLGAALDDAVSTLDMAVPYLVYCHGDEPSRAGATQLVEEGFSPVYRLIGNYGAWTDAGYPVETE